MTTWNYRVCREKVPDGEGGTEFYFTIREVYYDDDGKPNGWTQEPATFAGDTAVECFDALSKASGCAGAGVLDLDTKETVSLHGGPWPPQRKRRRR